MGLKNQIYYVLGLILFSLVIFNITQSHFYWNWDTEAYLGLMLKSAHPEWDITKLHQETMQIFIHTAPAKRFNLPPITPVPNLENYYSYIIKSPLLFKEELAIFDVKPGYQGLLLLFYKLGFEVPKVFILVNSLGALMAFVFFYKILENVNKNIYFKVLMILIAFFYFSPTQALYNASPDMLGCGFGMMFLYNLIKKRRWETAWAAVLVVLCRPDYIFFVIFLQVVIPRPVTISIFKNNALFTVLPIVIYGIIQSCNTISWNALITNQFFQPVLFIETNPITTPLKDYLIFMLRQLPGNVLHSPVIGISLLSLAYIIFSFVRKKYYQGLVILGITANMYLHFAFFPSFAGRMMLFMYLAWLLIMGLFLNKKTSAIR